MVRKIPFYRRRRHTTRTTQQATAMTYVRVRGARIIKRKYKQARQQSTSSVKKSLQKLDD
jgi:hypothetical protein